MCVVQGIEPSAPLHVRHSVYHWANTPEQAEQCKVLIACHSVVEWALPRCQRAVFFLEVIKDNLFSLSFGLLAGFDIVAICLSSSQTDLLSLN